MSVMNTELYDALRSAAGVDEEKARAAAQSVAEYESRFNKLDIELARIHSELTGHRIILGLIAAMSTAILIRVYWP